MLVNGAQCSEGACCSETCRFYPIGTTCRVATQECDILEYCLGDSSDCPRDVHLQDGHMCNSGNDFCFSGVCQILDNKCQRFFGELQPTLLITLLCVELDLTLSFHCPN